MLTDQANSCKSKSKTLFFRKSTCKAENIKLECPVKINTSKGFILKTNRMELNETEDSQNYHPS